MKIIALEREVNTARTIDFRKNSKAEAKVLWQLYTKGIVREFYFREDKSLAVLILEVKNKNEARKALSLLPFVKNKLIEFDFIPIKPYPGFKRLFR